MSVTIDWNATFENSPNGSESLGNGDNRILALKTALRERLEKEHKFDVAGTQADHGQHLAGSAISYYQAAAPTTRPDGVTALSADDNGRIWVASVNGYIYYYAHTSWVLLNGPADSVVDQGGGDNLKCKVIEIGGWNMDTTANVGILHNLTLGFIRSVDVIIKSDLGFVNKPLNYVDPTTGVGGYITFGLTSIALYRTLGGPFDHTDYDSTGSSRGWITIWYQE